MKRCIGNVFTDNVFRLAAWIWLPLALGAGQALAANGDVTITVQNELGAALPGASFTFRTAGMGATQTVVDGSADDADGASNGTIVVLAATMTGFGACSGGGAGCGGGGGGGGGDPWLTKNVTKAGYVSDIGITITSGGGGGGANYRTTAADNGTGNLAFTVRVNRPNDQFGNPITLAASNTSFSGLTLTDAISFNGGRAYLPASPAAPGILTLTRTGFLSSVTTAAVTPLATGQVTLNFGTGGGQDGAALQYNIVVTAQDELGNALNLTGATAAFSGLTLSGAEQYNGGAAYLPADPAAPAKLTLSLSGYVNTQTAATITPNVSQVQNLSFKPAGGDAPGLPFAVFVRAWDELNNRRLNLTAASAGFNGGLSLNGAIRYSDSAAYIPLRAASVLTVSQKGYIDTRTAATVTPVATKQDTVDYKAGAGFAGAGLPFSFRMRIKDASNANLNGARVDVLTGAEARAKDVYGDSIWTSASPKGADSGYVYIPFDETLDDNATLTLRVQHARYLTDQSQHLLAELNAGFQIQRILQMGAQLAAPALRAPGNGDIVHTLRPTLMWTGGAGADSFEVAVNPKRDFTGTGLDTGITADTLKLPANLADKTTYYWHVRAKGMGGTTGPYGDTWSFQVNLDNTPPVVILPAPGADSLFTGKVSIKFSATDNDTVVSREISVDGGAFTAATTDSTYAWNTAAVPDGSHTLQVRATDRGQNVGVSAIISVRVDNSPPALSVIAMRYQGAGPLTRKGGTVLLQVQARDAAAGMSKDSAVILTAPALDSAHKRIALHDDGADGDVSAGDGVYSILLPLNTDSTHIGFNVRARDRLGHDTTVTGVFRLDVMVPILSFRVEPAAANGQDGLHGNVYTDKVVVKGQVADSGGAGLASVRIEVRNDSGAAVQNSPILIPAHAGPFSQIVALVPGNNHVTLIAEDSAGNIDSVSSLLDYIDPKVSKLIDTKGGTVSAPDGSGVTIGGDALNGPLEVTVREVPPSEEPKPRDASLRLLGVPREFGPDKTVFRKPVTITLAYTEADLDPNQDGHPDFAAANLTIVFWDGQSWVKAGEAQVDVAHHLVSVAVNHFTLFDLAQSDAAAPNAVTAFWTRNPFTPSQGSVFSYALPASGKVSLNVLDLAGDLVREIIPRGTEKSQGQWSEVWRGDNVSGHFAGVGLYVYIFKYESDDGKTKKMIRLPIGVGK